MDCCVTIIICTQSLIDCAPKHLLNDKGQLTFSTSLRLTKKRAELNEFGTLKGAGAFGFSLDYGKLSNYLFSEAFNLYNVDFDLKKIDVIVKARDKILEFDTLCFLYESDSDKTYELQLLQLNNNFKARAKEQSICCDTLDYPDVCYDLLSLQQNWDNENEYLDQLSDGYYMGAVDYGGAEGQGVRLDYLKPLFHKKHLLEQLMCKIGYELCAPAFDTPWGRKQIGMFTGNLNNVESEEKFGLKVKPIDTLNLILVGNNYSVPFNETIYDAGPFWSNGQAARFTGKYRYCYCIEILSSAGNVPFTFNLNVAQGNGAVTLSPDFTYSGSGTEKFFFESEAVDLENAILNTLIFTRIAGIAPPSIIIGENSFFQVKPISVEVVWGQCYKAYNFLDASITTDKLFEALTHDINGLVHVDNATKKVYLFSPDDANVFNEIVQGFFRDEIDYSLQNKAICDSRRIDNQKSTLKRYCVVGYKEPTDVCVKDLGYGKKRPLHGTIIDRGDEYLDEVEYKLNPMFEATIDKEIGTTEDGDFAIIPVMWDNDGGEKLSNNLCPRQLTAIGPVKQILSTDANGVRTYRIFRRGVVLPDGTTFFTDGETIPFVSQCPQVVLEGPDGEIIEEPCYNTYDDKPFSQFNMFWKSSIQEALSNLLIEMLMQLSIADYCNIDFRNNYCITYNRETFTYRFIEVLDFNVCTFLTTPVRMQAKRLK